MLFSSHPPNSPHIGLTNNKMLDNTEWTKELSDFHRNRSRLIKKYLEHWFVFPRFISYTQQNPFVIRTKSTDNQCLRHLFLIYMLVMCQRIDTAWRSQINIIWKSFRFSMPQFRAGVYRCVYIRVCVRAYVIAHTNKRVVDVQLNSLAAWSVGWLFADLLSLLDICLAIAPINTQLMPHGRYERTHPYTN